MWTQPRYPRGPHAHVSLCFSICAVIQLVVHCQVNIRMSKKGYKCMPQASKVERWTREIEEVLASGRLWPGAASKLAGRLSWGSSAMFRKLGRAMLRPIHDQKSRRDGHMSEELKASLHWWHEVLQSSLCERRAWFEQSRSVVHLFCDASGQPGYLGAVLLADGSCWYTHCAPPSEVVEKFRRRSDRQIMGLELLAISLGLQSFKRLLKHRHVIVHSDNTGSEVDIA